MLCIVGIDAAVDYRLADKGEGDTNGSPEKRLAASDSIDQEGDENEIWSLLLVPYLQSILSLVGYLTY